MNEKINLVIAKSFNIFWVEAFQRFEDSLDRVKKTQGQFSLKDGSRYIFVSGDRQLEGFRGVKVHLWGPLPGWYLSDQNRVEHLVRLAEMQ